MFVGTAVMNEIIMHAHFCSIVSARIQRGGGETLRPVSVCPEGI